MRERCLTIQIPHLRDTPTGEWLRKLDNRCITQTIHKLKWQSAAINDQCAFAQVSVRPVDSDAARHPRPAAFRSEQQSKILFNSFPTRSNGSSAVLGGVSTSRHGILAVKKLHINAVCRAIRRKLYRGLNIAMPKSLLVGPNPMSSHKMCGLSISEWPTMIKCESLLVGCLHGKCLGLLWR